MAPTSHLPPDLQSQVLYLAQRHNLPVKTVAHRLAEASAKRRIGLADASNPGELACRLDPTVVQRPHLELIDNAFAKMLAGDVDRVLITTPPQVGKTLRAAIWGPFFWLTHRPWHRIILVSYGSDLARKRGRSVRALVRRHGADYGLRLDPERSAAHEWELTTGGGMKSAGMTTGVTGAPADAIFIDDPHKDRAEADSHVIKEAIWDTYSSSLLSRMAPGAPLFLIQTRWSPDDLAGRVLADEGTLEQGGRWMVIHLPALADPKFGPDPLGRSPGQPLVRPDLDPHDLAAAVKHWEDKKATSTPRDFASLYQGDPQPPSGQLVTQQLLRRQRDYHSTVAPVIIAVAVDPSGGGRDTAGVIAGHLGEDQRLYWTHDRSGVHSAEQWAKAACLLAHQVGADRIIYEQNYGKDMVKLALTTAWESLSSQAAQAGQEPWGLCPRLVPQNSKRGKLLRAEPIAQQLAEDRIRLAAPLLDLEAEWLTWRPDTWSPGRIDASVHLAYSLLPIPGAQALVSSPAQVSLSQVPEQPGSWTSVSIGG